jgi:hypothetical protein
VNPEFRELPRSVIFFPALLFRDFTVVRVGPNASSDAEILSYRQTGEIIRQKVQVTASEIHDVALNLSGKSDRFTQGSAGERVNPQIGEFGNAQTC